MKIKKKINPSPERRDRKCPGNSLILLQDNTRIRVLYETKNNLHFISDFRITDSAQIKGTNGRL
ncbi:MAG: hypothetical protein NTY14_04735 [Candidatus Omnitrophica bacterium]|nr:hypothetical protein [Candidatus Omnitrophota bacterium]